MIALMGANGNITSKAAKLLLADGRRVRVIGRDATHMSQLKAAGAGLSIGDALDTDFLTDAFRGAEAVYTMIPPAYATPDHRAYQNAVGEAVAQAIVDAGVKKVVNLSSIGAPLLYGTGLIAGLHDQEERLNRLAGVDILHLRPAYFMENHLSAIPLIKAMSVYPGMIAPNVSIPMIGTEDIAAVLTTALMRRSFTGHDVNHVLGPRSYTMTETARILGVAIGKSDLKYVQAEPAQVKAGMVQHGFSQNVADMFEEMSVALSDGRIDATFTRAGATITPTTLESFAATFAQAYQDVAAS